MIIVMGTPGAGKSTVLSEAIKQRPKWELVNYGDLMLAIAIKNKLANSRDELRKLSIANQKKIQSDVAARLSKMTGNVILDTHCSINTPTGYYPGLPHTLLSKLKVDALVLVGAPMGQILTRRRADTSRVRDEQTEEMLAEHVRINEGMLSAYAILSGAPATVIQNHDGKLHESVARFVRILDSFKQ
jgi:adenylate kinase